MTDDEMLIEAERSALIAEVVTKINATPGAVLNHRTVQSSLPSDFKYDRERDSFMRFVDQEMPILPLPVADVIEPPPVVLSSDVTTEPVEDGLPADPFERGQVLRAQLVELDQQAATQRARGYTLNTLAQSARGRMAAEIQRMNRAVPPLSAEANARQFIASEQAMRKAKADGFVTQGDARPARPGPSVLDRQAFYGKDNSAEGHVRATMQYGGIRNRARNQAAAVAARAKLPSVS